MEAKQMLFEDALKSAIKSEKNNIILKKWLKISVMLNVLLLAIIVLGGING